METRIPDNKVIDQYTAQRYMIWIERDSFDPKETEYSWSFKYHWENEDDPYITDFYHGNVKLHKPLLNEEIIDACYESIPFGFRNDPLVSEIKG